MACVGATIIVEDYSDTKWCMMIVLDNLHPLAWFLLTPPRTARTSSSAHRRTLDKAHPAAGLTSFAPSTIHLVAAHILHGSYGGHLPSRAHMRSTSFFYL